MVFSAENYSDMRLGPGKGNPSRTGHRVAVRAKFGNQSAVVFVFDISTRSKFPDIQLADLPGTNNSCTIAPLGEKIICTQKLDDGVLATFILSKEGTVVGKWLENHRPGHGDLTLGEDGIEYSVGISKSSPDKYKVIKRSLLVDKLESGLVFTESSAGFSPGTDQEALNIVFKPTSADRKSCRHFALTGTAIRNSRAMNTDDAVIVVINAPPVGVAPEVRSIIGLADAVIFAVEWGSTDRNVARAALQVLTRSITNSGSIKTALTNVNLRKQKSFASGDAGDFLRI